MLEDLLKRSLLIVLGKGGVGKTTVAAALARSAARAGVPTLALETDPRGPLAAVLGHRPSLEPIEVAPRLATMVLEGRHALEEYLQLVVPGQAVLKAVFSSKLYQYFVQAAPGLRELMMLGKLYYEVERKPVGQRRWKLLVFDAGSSGQALGLLRMASAARETFGESIVGREARNIGRMLREERLSAVVQVTTPEALALAETLETQEALGELKLEVAAILLNRCNPTRFSAADLARLRRRGALRRELRHLDHLTAVAQQELERAALAREALAVLRSRTSSRIIELPEYRNLSGPELAHRLTSDLADLGGSVAAHPA